MKIRSVLTAICALALGSIGAHSSRASEVLYDGVGFLQGTQTFTDSFNLASPGTLTVTLGNIPFPDALSGLQLLVSTPSGSLGTMQQETVGSSTSSFAVTSGNVTAQWFGTAQGAMDTGVYSLEIQYQPGSNAVPLPTSIALLLSGIGLLLWQRRTRSEACVRSSVDCPRLQ
jgi:hypothetical protein